MNPIEAISSGRAILDPVMVSAGFRFVAGTDGSSSGGHFAQASYVNDDRRLEFSYRYALGLATYYIGSISISHETYMRFLGRERDSAYLWYSHDSPMTGFEALKHDLELYCQDFLTGTGDSLVKAAQAMHCQ